MIEKNKKGKITWVDYKEWLLIGMIIFIMFDLIDVAIEWTDILFQINEFWYWYIALLVIVKIVYNWFFITVAYFILKALKLI